MCRRITVVVLCVCLSVCSVTTIAATTYLFYTFSNEVSGLIWYFQGCSPWLSLKHFVQKLWHNFLTTQPSWLLDELSMNKRDSNGFFSTRLEYRDSDSSYNTTDLSLILILISPLSSKASWLQNLLGFSLCICNIGRLASSQIVAVDTPIQSQLGDLVVFSSRAYYRNFTMSN